MYLSNKMHISIFLEFLNNEVLKFLTNHSDVSRPWNASALHNRAFKGALHFRNATGVPFSSGQRIRIVHLLLLCASFAPWATEYTGPYEESFWECGGSVWEPEFKATAFKQQHMNKLRGGNSYTPC